MIHTAYFHYDISPRDHKIVSDFVSSIIWGKTMEWPYSRSMAVMEDGKLIGGTVFHDYDQSSNIVELSSASVSKKWLTRPVIRAMFHMPFNMLSCQACVLRISEKNSTMLRIARSFGFEEYKIPRLFGRNEAGHIFMMTDDMWKSHKINKEAA